MDLELSEEQKLITDTVRRFVRNEIVPLEADLDPDGSELNPEDHARLVAQVRQMGFYGLDIPPEYGGPEVDLVTRTLMAIEMCAASAALARRRARKSCARAPMPECGHACRR